jgi:two-component system sensor histidine kinase YesM
MRFSKRLQTYFAECPEQYLNVKVPRLILQPIIENSFEHGIEIKKQVGIIKVSFDSSENQLFILIEDNGSDISDTRLSELQNTIEQTGEETEITGIINIHRRIRLVYGEGSGLQFARSDLGGLIVRMKIDLAGERVNE